MATKFKVGQKVIELAHDEEGTVVEIKYHRHGGHSYKVQLDRFANSKEVDGKQIGLFSYSDSELIPWKPRRFIRFGDHHMRLVDSPSGVGGEFCGYGTWGIKDTYTDQVVFWVTSGGAYWIVKELCRAMNDGVILQEMTKRYY